MSHCSNTLRTLLFFAIACQICVATSCPNNCNERGYCHNGECICFVGFDDDYTPNEIEDCSDPMWGTNSVVVDAFRYLWIVVFSVSCLMSLLAIIDFVTREHNVIFSRAFTMNSSFISLVSVLLVCIAQLIYQVQPAGTDIRVFSYAVTQVFGGLCYPLLQISYVSILFNWIELYNTATKALSQEYMLAKINSSYQPKEITLQEVEQKARFLSGLRVPFIVLGVVGFLLEFIADLLMGLQLILPYIPIIIWVAWFFLVWLVILISFLVYGRRLAELLPKQPLKRFTRVTRSLRVLSIVMIVAVVVKTIFAVIGTVADPLVSTAFTFIELTKAVMTYSCLLMNVRFEKRFPYVFVSSSSESGGTATKSETSGSIQMSVV